MQHSTGSFEKIERKDTSFKVELPERSSTYLPHQKGLVSPRRNRVSSPGLESLKDLVDKDGKNANVDQPEKEYFTPYHTAPEVHERPTRNPKKQKKLLFGVIALATCILVGLGVGLGLGLTRNKG